MTGTGPARWSSKLDSDPKHLKRLLYAAIDNVVTAEANDTVRDVRIANAVRLHVIEGDDAEFQVGETTPVPQRTVSDAGTVTTTGFEYIDTGLILNVSVRTEPDGRLRVILEPEMSAISGTIEGAPVRTRRRLSTASVLEPGGAIVVGGFDRHEQVRQREGLPDQTDLWASHHTTENNSSRLYVVCRVIDPTQPYAEGDPGSSQPALPATVPGSSEASTPQQHTTAAEAMRFIELAAINTHQPTTWPQYVFNP